MLVQASVSSHLPYCNSLLHGILASNLASVKPCSHSCWNDLYKAYQSYCYLLTKEEAEAQRLEVIHTTQLLSDLAELKHVSFCSVQGSFHSTTYFSHGRIHSDSQ